MTLLKYLILTLGVLLLHVEAKAFLANKDKGTFDHMNDNLYLEKLPDGYEMRYVPHVDGKPIFIPFDETIPTNVFKATKMPIPKIIKNEAKVEQIEIPFQTSEYLKMDSKSKEADHPLIIDVVTKATMPILKYTKNKAKVQQKDIPFQTSEYLKMDSKTKEADHPLIIDVVTKATKMPVPKFTKNGAKVEYKDIPFQTSEYLKMDSKTKETDHPLIIDAVTKAGYLKRDIRPIKKKPEVTKPTEQIKKYETGVYTVNAKEEINTSSILRLDPDKRSKSKEKMPNNYEKKDGISIHQDYVTPTHLESLTKKSFTVESLKNQAINKKPSEKYNKKLDTKISKDKTKFDEASSKHQNGIESFEENSFSPIERDQDYDSPVIVEALIKRNPANLVQKSEMYESPVIVEALVKKTDMNEDLRENFPTKSVEALVNENSIKYSTEMFQNKLSEDLFDTGSGIIDERSSNFWLFHSQERNKFKKCTTPNDEPGNCLPIQLCPAPNFQLTLDDLMKKICAIDDVFIGICCPEFPAETLKVAWEKNVSRNDQESFEMKSRECGKMKEESDSWPWMAPLMSMSTRKIFCGGVLINAQYVLTAAHCTRKIPHNQIVIVLGPYLNDTASREYEVVEIKRHAQYNPRSMQFDIALLKLSRKVSRPVICLPREETFVGMQAIMLGWRGTFTASKIEEELLVLSPKECPRGDILCTEPRTEDVMCNVDSGAPLILKQNERYEVIGLLTWNRNDCNFPALFTRVSQFKGWIENHSSF